MIKVIVSLLLWLSFTGICPAGEVLKLHFIDVGEGDAALIQYKGENALIDTGGLYGGFKLKNYLKTNGVSEIKYIIITHPHSDHMAGIFFILPEFRVGRIYDNGQKIGNADEAERSYNVLVRENQIYRPLKRGDSLNLKEITLQVLWPQQPDRAAAGNESSLVIKLNFNDKFYCLFTGDFIDSGQERLLKERNNTFSGVYATGFKINDLKADILKVPHHGTADALTQAFLDAVSPKVAIVTPGNEKSGDYSPLTDELLSKKGITVYRTEIDGNVIINVDSDGKYTIETSND